MRPLLGIALAAGLVAAAGCGDGTTDVTGKVTYHGKPVVFGTVLIIGADGVPKSGPIQPDGTFRVSGVKTGPARVTVSSPPPPGSTAAAPRPNAGREADDEKVPPDQAPVSPEVAKAWVPLPEKYGDPDKTDLRAEIKAGQPLELELK